MGLMPTGKNTPALTEAYRIHNEIEPCSDYSLTGRRMEKCPNQAHLHLDNRRSECPRPLRLGRLFHAARRRFGETRLR